MLFRKGKKWLWIINIIGMVLLAVLPLKIAHQMVLPILWFLQVSRLSDITTKETTNNVHYFTFASYKPIARVLNSQVLAAIVLIVALASPIIVRYLILFNLFAAITIVLGGIFIVLLAVLLGIITKGKKMFEVLFFMVTYANINGILFADYFGGYEHNLLYISLLCIWIVIFTSITLLVRKWQLNT